MAKCEFCGKDVKFGIKVSHSHRRSNRTWKPNVQRVKAIVDGSPKRVYACTRCLRSGKVTRANWFLWNYKTASPNWWSCFFANKINKEHLKKPVVDDLTIGFLV